MISKLVRGLSRFRTGIDRSGSQKKVILQGIKTPSVVRGVSG
ncbi:hypothetical protein XCR1_4250005 [Xenorhabdus cabanillasii JM26]|uniref:Uncharacterized protein n=1 Tax=Xenorhabdus cabanillasii JM26 TaxID=1427517 RepID=W1J783_9GAMM|nr:hypothetical protein XCR1_4250005 [Xenorhabdus cabanillasii JM26]